MLLFLQSTLKKKKALFSTWRHKSEAEEQARHLPAVFPIQSDHREDENTSRYCTKKCLRIENITATEETHSQQPGLKAQTAYVHADNFSRK